MRLCLSLLPGIGTEGKAYLSRYSAFLGRPFIGRLAREELPSDHPDKYTEVIGYAGEDFWDVLQGGVTGTS